MGMGRMKALTILLLAALMASSLISVQAYTINSISKPSSPKFTVKLAAYPYDVPDETIKTVDEYTGKEITITNPGYHVENKCIEIVIKNPQFTPYTLTKHTGINHETGESYTYDRNCTVNLYYNVNVKGHFGDKWEGVPTSYSYYGPQSNAQLDSNYTVITIKDNYSADSVLDFQVKVLIGYYAEYFSDHIMPMGIDFYGQESEWSKIQTLNMTQTTTPSQNVPIQADTLFGFNLEQTSIIIAIVTIVVLAALSIFLRKRSVKGGV